MWKNILAASVLVLSVSVLLQSIRSAQANQSAVSFEQNPIFSKGGYNGATQTIHTISAITGQEILFTDITLSGQYNDDIELIFTSGGEVIGRYKTWNYANYAGSGILDTHLLSDLRAPEGEDVVVTINGRWTLHLLAHIFIHSSLV